MPCPHKFSKYLNLDKLTFQPTTLIVGTFNPAWPAHNHAEWFYGRTDNNYFWDVLPRLSNEASLIDATPDAWKQFCSRNQIAITDLIACINDADENNADHCKHLGGYSDLAISKHFECFSGVPVIELLKNHPTIQNVYLTRGAGPTFWKSRWAPVKEHCVRNGLWVNELLTPSGYAYYQHGRYKKLHPEAPLSLSDFILKKWDEKWHMR